MKKVINYYPIASDELIEDINPYIEYTFSYEKEKGEWEEIEHDESIGDNISLVVGNVDWNPYEYDLKLETNIGIKDGYKLYGPDGIAPKGSEIGLCLEFYSQKSRIREVDLGDDALSDSEDEYSFSSEYILKKNTYLSDVDINLFLYLRKPATNVDKDSKHLNNKEGVIIGTLDHRRIFVIGTGSLFPIHVEELDSNKLWSFDLDYENPEIDKFIDCTKLVLNSNHKDYDLVNPKSDKYCDRLILEIICSCLYMTFAKLKEEGYLDNINDSYLDGSIMSLVTYYKDTLGIDFSSSQSIFDSLQQYVGKGYTNV